MTAMMANGVAIRHPRISGMRDLQWMSLHIPGRRWRLAAISSMKIDGTISAGFRRRLSDVIARSENPNPE
jgi:hypothetical protein